MKEQIKITEQTLIDNKEKLQEMYRPLIIEAINNELEKLEYEQIEFVFAFIQGLKGKGV